MSSPESKDSQSAASGYALSLFELLISPKNDTVTTESVSVTSEPESATRWRVPAEGAPAGTEKSGPMDLTPVTSKSAAG
ncbi:MAG: hypothetical protein QM784_22975 [Polyangiaceae bacterium]